MADRLTDSQMNKLVEIYRDYECLWNVKSPLYKKRETRDAAYTHICERLNIPGLSMKMIPKKIKNLRSSYYQELKKIENSRSGVGKEPVYDPKVSWFKMANGFLKDFTKKRRTVLNIDDSSSSDNESESQSTKSAETFKPGENADENIQDNKNVVWVVNHISTPPVQITQSDIPSPTYIVAPKTPVKKGKIDNRKEDDILEAIAKLDKIANSITKTANTLAEKEEDEFDTFGKYIAMTLRSLPKELAIVGKTNVQKAISEIQLRALEKSEQSTWLSYGASSSNACVKIELDP